MNFEKIKQYIIHLLDVLQRALSKDRCHHLSRAELIEQLANAYAQKESQAQELNRQILHLLDDVEAMARGDLSWRTRITDKNLLDFAITGAIYDGLNFFLDDLCPLLAQLPEESPLRRKYQLPQNFNTDFLSQPASPTEISLETEFERFMHKLLRTLDDAEAVVQGDLLHRVKDYSDQDDDYGSLYNDFYALVDCFNLILEDLSQAIKDLPAHHPLRQKYQLKQSEG